MAVITTSVTREMLRTFYFHCDQASWYLHSLRRSLLTKLNMSDMFHCGSDQHKRFFIAISMHVRGVTKHSWRHNRSASSRGFPCSS